MKTFPQIFLLLASFVAGSAQAAVVLTASGTTPATDIFDQFNLGTDAVIPGTNPFAFNSQAFSDNAGPPGQSFTTAAGGPFLLNAFSFLGAATGSGNIGGSVQLGTWGIRVSSVSGTTLNPLLTVTNIASPTALAGNEWMTWTFSDADLLTLSPSTTYAVEVFSSQGYYGFDASLDPAGYAGGVAFNSTGTARAFSSNTLQDRGYDRTFVADVSLVPEPGGTCALICGWVLVQSRRRRALFAKSDCSPGGK